MVEQGRQACSSPLSSKRIVIAGGGYAGTTLAVRLGRRIRPEDGIEVILVEPDPCQQALSELDLVAVGPARPEFCELWHPTVFRDLPVTVCYNRLHDVDAPSHTAIIGPREGEHQRVEYWRLVLATGAVAFVPPVPGLAENAVTMWSVEDAQELQRRIEAAFKHAATLHDREERSRALSFTVIGGGATGIEIVGTLGQMLPRRARDAGLDVEDLRVRVIEGRSDILYDLPKPQRAKAVARLERMGVEIVLGSMVERVEPGAVVLQSGRRVDANVLVFCGGAKPDPDAVDWGLDIETSGRLTCDEYLRSVHHEDIYIVGDVAAFRDPKTNKVLPMLAQFAIRQAEHTADNLLREARGEQITPFVPHMHGEFVSVGPSWGVGWMFRWHVSGLPAIIMKRLTYVLYWFTVGGVRLALKRTREMLAMHR
jgi:NADH:ubiquinone reductase (H+-translocating)